MSERIGLWVYTLTLPVMIGIGEHAAGIGGIAIVWFFYCFLAWCADK